MPAGRPERDGLRSATVLRQMLAGYWISQSLYLAARIGVADLLKDGSLTSLEIARATGVDESALRRLMRGLASLGAFVEDVDGRYGLTEIGRWLRTDVPGSLRALAIWNGDLPFRVWGEALHSLTTSEPALERVLGRGLFSHLREDGEAAAVFHRAMAGLADHTAAAVLAAYDFSGLGTIADVGGGEGVLLAAILTEYPDLCGILYDLPDAADVARRRLDAAGVTGRCEVRAGDFLESVPSADAYVLSSVIHDWDDERGLRILRNCRRAMRGEGIVLLVDTILPDRPGPSFSKLLDLQMLVVTGGRERNEAECARLLAAAGLRLKRTIATECPETIIEAVPTDEPVGPA